MKKRLSSPIRICMNILITLVAAAIYFYIALPPINMQSGEFWTFLLLILVFFCVLTLLSQRNVQEKAASGSLFSFLWKNLRIPVILMGICLVICLIGSILSAVIFNTKAYSSLITLEESDFAEDVAEISYDQIPMLDEVSANTLAARKLGELSDLVSQFEVDATSAQINYQNAPVRVTYLNYGDFFKWINNRSEGIPAYIVTDMVTQEVSVVRLEEGMKYTPSEPFNRNIDRYLRFKYPFTMFSDVNFEIDEEGTPYWVASVMKKTIGLFGGADITGAVLVNAVTGECTYCAIDEIPSWVDRVFTADLIIEQYDYHGKYKNGFWNSIFGQKGCTVTTDGYNYIAQNDDVWVYTGVTSMGGDESNTGFILVNQRTKEAKYYSVAGAEEYSAMSSAEGSVQQYSYTATFPLLLNIEGQPTYFMALKDESNLVKMYAMVNVQQYQIVSNGSSLAECEQNYYELLRENKIISDDTQSPITEQETETVTGNITELRSAVIEGTTYYYIKLDILPETWFRLSAAESEEIVLYNIGDSVTLTFEKEEASIQPAKIDGSSES